MVKVLENVFRGIICSFAVNNRSNLWQYWTQMFTLFPAAIFVLLHGVPRVSPINFCYTFWRTTLQRKTAQTWDLIYRYSIISEILGFRHPTVLILVFDGVTVKTTNIFPLSFVISSKSDEGWRSSQFWSAFLLLHGIQIKLCWCTRLNSILFLVFNRFQWWIQFKFSR